MRRPSLGRVLVAAIGGVAVGAVLLTALVTFGLARLGAPARALGQLGGEAERVADLAAELPCEGRPRPALGREFGPRVRFVPDAGRRQFAAAPEGRTLLGGRPVYYASRPATVCGRPGSIVVFQPVADTPALPEGFTSRLVLAGLIGLAGASIVAFVLSRRMSRPLGELSQSARAVARGESGGVAAPRASDPAEIAELKEAFGGMVADLNSAREHEKAFLLSISHELRTPLTAIRGYGEALADGTATDARRAGDVVARESVRLDRLVQDLLDLGRLEAGEFSIRPRSVDLADVAASAVDALRPVAGESDVALVFDTNGPAPAKTDPDRVHQMIANLVENAVRVTPEGGTVGVEVSEKLIAVTDDGPGLDPADIEHAFERFYLWRKYQGVRPVGSGLGLAIVAELAQRLGVGVAVGSRPGAGSRFELRFRA
ncbi:MAG TPA: HAMP domain-containing sensor histidine kinase [Actinomycetota bacterium]|jgi:two-component system sensor histidine kinase BaeS|nr:HAMP domain-containing sensor histidine kinase [Actinomycetota bacterium]